MNPKDIVRQGYDKISYAYRGDDGSGMQSDYAGWLATLTPLLSPGSPVVELGCGCGVPVARILSENYPYTGVDISPVQIKRAQKLVPEGRFICADMANVEFAEATLAAVVSFYAVIHLPVEEQPTLFERIYYWLQSGGCLLAIVGHTAWTGTEDDWLGAEMYWSLADEATYLAWLSEIGFQVRWVRFIPEGNGGHTLLMAQKP